MRKAKGLAAVTLSLVSINAFAIFCPTNFTEIHIGDSAESVTAACGKPDAIKKSKTIVNQPQEWNYYITMSPGDQGTVKMTVAFNEDKVVNMNVNGVGVTYTAICQNNTAQIQIGDSQDAVRKACGNPVFINQGNAENGQEQPQTIEDWIYTSSTPTITLEFIAGKLTKRIEGS